MTDDILLFKSAEEFADRPGYFHVLTVVRTELDRIVGKFSFPKDRQLQCGLNGCNHWHQNGYVIRTKDGCETHCGKDCGKREFGVEFKEVEATFKRKLEDQERRDWLNSVLSEKDALLDKVGALLARLGAVSAKIKEVRDRLAKEPELVLALDKAIRSGGAVQKERFVDAETASAMGLTRGQRHQLETVAILAGADALALVPQSKRPAIEDVAARLRLVVLPDLKDLSIGSLANLNTRQRKERARRIEGHHQAIAQAAELLAAGEKFIAPQNLRRLGQLPVSRPSQRANRILHSFATHADEVARDLGG